MRKAAAFTVVLLLTAGAALAGSNGQDFATIERGRYLTIVGDCAGCHDQPGGAPFAGGRKIETPLGP
jgi:cytochrome c553